MISADYYPEGKEPKGFMRIEDGKVTEHENASSFAAPHVRNELKRLAKMETHQQRKRFYGTKYHQSETASGIFILKNINTVIKTMIARHKTCYFCTYF